MGSSLSVLAIVAEREVFDHEHFFYLRISSYLLAKMVVLGGMALVQTVVFLGVLTGLRAGPDDAKLFGLPWVAGTLWLVELGAVALGLFLSALGNRSKDTANLLLPLVMIGQIVFSVQVCGNGGSLEEAYQTFHLHACAAWPERRAVRWIPSQGGWLSQGARQLYRQALQERTGPGGPPVLRPEEHAQILQWVHDQPRSELTNEPTPPHALVAGLSYLTLSRHGDIVLRSFAYYEENYDVFRGKAKAADESRYAYADWRRGALGALVLLWIALLCVTGVTLAGQNRWRGNR
jgi:hypothetical protein